MTNRKTTKRALFTSTLALLMCVAMLIGTTFAWFTDTASTNVNKVQAGTLDVDLQVATQYNLVQKDDGTFEFQGIGGWVSVDGETLNFIQPVGHESDPILWEPGCTHRLPPLRVINNGNLALKYKVAVTGINGDAELNEAIDWLVSASSYNSNDIITLQPGAMERFAVKGHMREDAGNEYQGLSIEGVSITVYATQGSAEYDSFSKDYDRYAEFPVLYDSTTSASTAEGFSSAVSSAPTTGSSLITLGCNIVNTTVVPNQNDVANTVANGQNLTVDLAGKTFTSTVKIFRVENGGTLTLKSSVPGGKIYVDNNAGGNRFAVIVEEGGTLNIEDGVTIEMKAFDTTPNAGAIYNTGTVNMNGGKILVYDTAAVMNMSGTFNMNGGEISLNTAEGAALGHQAYGLTCTEAVINLNAGSITGKGYAIKIYDFGSTVTTVNTATGFANTVVEP